jgi:hypothetical protein
MLFGLSCSYFTLFAHQSNVKDVVRLIARMLWCTKVMQWVAEFMHAHRGQQAHSMWDESAK